MNRQQAQLHLEDWLGSMGRSCKVDWPQWTQEDFDAVEALLHEEDRILDSTLGKDPSLPDVPGFMLPRKPILLTFSMAMDGGLMLRAVSTVTYHARYCRMALGDVVERGKLLRVWTERGITNHLIMGGLDKADMPGGLERLLKAANWKDQE